MRAVEEELREYVAKRVEPVMTRVLEDVYLARHSIEDPYDVPAALLTALRRTPVVWRKRRQVPPRLPPVLDLCKAACKRRPQNVARWCIEELEKRPVFMRFSDKVPAWLVPRDWALVWKDDFDYEGLPDPRRWAFQTSCNKWIHDDKHRELQWYTADRRANAWVQDGCLNITAIKEAWQGQQYTSARLHTKHKGDWRYGRIEVCAKLPGGAGLWPAVWLLPTDSKYGEWPNSGEIDMCETVGWMRDVVHTAVHTATFNHRLKTQHKAKTVVRQDEFHVYTIVWRPDHIDFCVDGDAVHAFSRTPSSSWREWPFDERFFLLVNVAVGGKWAGRFGVDDSRFPATLQVAYVRVFEWGGSHKPYPDESPA